MLNKMVDEGHLIRASFGAYDFAEKYKEKDDGGEIIENLNSE